MSTETVTVEQQEALIEFLERHRELALGRFSRTKEGRSLSKRLWMECANILNSVSANCPTRGTEAWRTYYADYKSKLLKKIKKNKQELSATGGGQYTQLTLTNLQERLYNVLGRDVGEPLPGVRHNPLDVTFETEAGGEEINIIEAPWDGETPSTFSHSHEGPTSQATLNVIMEAMDTSTVRTAPITAAMVTTAAMASTTVATATTIASTVTTTAATVATTAAPVATTTVPRRTEPPRRRRRYHHREHEPEVTPLELAEQRPGESQRRCDFCACMCHREIGRCARWPQQKANTGGDSR